MGEKTVDIDIRDAIAIGRKEGVSGNISQGLVDAGTGQRFFACFCENDAPVLGAAVGQRLDVPGSQVDGKIGVVDRVVQEKIADNVSPVAQAENEVPKIEVTVMLHDMP